MRFQILRDVPLAKIACRVRRTFHPLLPSARSEQELATVILFRIHRDEKHAGAVLSSAAKAALRRLGPVADEKVLALAADFTREARELLTAGGVEPIGLSDFGWTDESYKRIRESP